MIIAIDGPAGSGKSTVAKLVARQLGVHYLDTGAMYRAVAVAALDAGHDLADTEAVVSVALAKPIGFAHEPGEPLPSRVFYGERDVTAEIRTPRADNAVSAVAVIPEVRSVMVERQREIGREGDIVVEGRDIGTVVFPSADLKVFLTASVEERARRRAVQQQDAGAEVTVQQVAAAIERRDRLDSEREVSPLVAAEDSVEVDTTGLTIAQVVDAICVLAGERRS